MDIKYFIEQLTKKYPIYLKNKFAGYPFTPIPLRGVRSYPKDPVVFSAAASGFRKYEKSDKTYGWTIEWRTIEFLGRQRWPSAITVDTEEDYLFLIGKKSSTKKILSRFDQLMQWQPCLQPLFEKNPDLVESNESLWDKLIPTIDFLLQNNVKGKLIREISVPVDTKFMESKQKLLFQLLKSIAPERGHPDAKTLEEYLELGSFPTIRLMKWLDSEMAKKYTWNITHFALNLTEWSRQTWDVDEIWLIENKTSFNKFPPRKKALAIFAEGFHLHMLKEMPSLQQARLYYWGDLDEHGFIMLSRMRGLYPQVKSAFMDLHTIHQHIEHMHQVPVEGKERPQYLTPAEWEAFDFLEENNGRIEQERIRGDYLIHYLESIDPGGTDTGDQGYSNFP